MSNATTLTGKNIDRARWAIIQRGLELEVKTGMRHSSNATVLGARAILEKAGIKPKRTKKALLEQFKALRAEQKAESTN